MLDHPDKGDDAPVPTRATVQHARDWITGLFHEVGGAWLKPFVNANPLGEIVFEWWHNDRTLTVYVTERSAEYVESWGANIRAEMADGDAEPAAVRRELWARLTGH